MKKKYWFWMGGFILLDIIIISTRTLIFKKGITASFIVSQTLSLLIIYFICLSQDEVGGKKVSEKHSNLDRALKLTFIYGAILFALTLIFFLLFLSYKIPLVDEWWQKIVLSFMCSVFIVGPIESLHLTHKIKKQLFYKLIRILIALVILFVLCTAGAMIWFSPSLGRFFLIIIPGTILVFFLIGLIFYSLYLKFGYIQPYHILKKQQEK